MSSREARHLSLQRERSGTRSPRPHLLIVCNGKTEKLYFEDLTRALRLSSAKTIRVESSSSNRLSLVQYIAECVREQGLTPQAGEPSERTEVWAVFDVDALGEPNERLCRQQVDNAIDLCKTQGFQWAVSNECFELWFLLHFVYCDAYLHREKIFEKLSAQLGMPYEKADNMFSLLCEKTVDAYKSAEKLCRSASECRIKPSGRASQTNVHELVERLFALHKEVEESRTPAASGERSLAEHMKAVLESLCPSSSLASISTVPVGKAKSRASSASSAKKASRKKI